MIVPASLRTLVLSGITTIVITFTPNALLAQGACPEGTRPATEKDLPIMKAAGITNARVGMCWEEGSPIVGHEVGEAKQYLNSLPKRPLSNCAPPTKENIYALNDSLAICAARFFQAYTAQYGTVYITSAFRNGEPGSGPDGVKSANKCAKGADDSNHTRGYAIDVNPANEDLYPTMWKFASDNPQFGVCFPYQDGKVGTGYYDRPHMALAGIGGKEGSSCAQQGVTKPCSGSNFDPSATPSASSAPTSSLVDRFRQALGLSQFACGGTNVVDRNNNVVRVCQYGCSGGQCIAPPVPQPPLPQQSGGSQVPLGAQPTQYFPQQSSGGSLGVTGTGGGGIPQQPLIGTGGGGTTNIPSGTSGGTNNTDTSGGTTNGTDFFTPDFQAPQSSITQQLLEIAYGTTSATGSPILGFIPISFNATDTAGVAGNQQTGGSSQGAQSQGTGSINPSQTFTSPDLSFSNPTPTSTTPPSAVQQILSDLRTALVRVLDVFRPFGISAALREPQPLEGE